MGTYDFDRFKDNSNTYLCKDSKGRQDLETAKTELNNAIQQNKTDTDRKLKELKESLKDRYVIIGDSYLEGYNPDGNVESFGIKLKKMMNASDEDWIIAYKGGTGFVNSINGINYKSLTQDAYNKTTNPEGITHVIYAGGYNDNGYTGEQIYNGIIDCYSKMRELFPNAVMYLANIGTTFSNNEVLWNLHDHVQYAFSYAGSGNNKICSFGYIGNALHERTMVGRDGFHPTDWGQNVIATALSYKLRGGDFEPVGRFKDFTASNNTPGVSVSTITGKEFYNKDILSLTLNRINFTVQPSIPTEIQWIVGDIKDTKYVRKTYTSMASIQTTGIVAYNGGSSFKTVSMNVGVNENGSFYVRLHTLNAEGTGYETLNNVKFIAFDDCTLRVPLCYI